MEAEWTWHVNSDKRTSGTSSDFTYDIPIPANMRLDRVVISRGQFPLSYYLISSNGKTDTFTLSEGGSEVTITIPTGNYNQKSMKSELETLLNAGSPNSWTYVVTISDRLSVQTGKYTFTVSGNSSQPSLIFTSLQNSRRVLGFNVGESVFVSDVLTSTNVTSVIAEPSIRVHSNIIKPDPVDILQDVYSSNTQDFSVISFIQYGLIENSKELSNVSSSYHFTITDTDDNILELNGIHVVFTLKFFRTEKMAEMVKSYLRKQAKESKIRGKINRA